MTNALTRSSDAVICRTSTQRRDNDIFEIEKYFQGKKSFLQKFAIGGQMPPNYYFPPHTGSLIGKFPGKVDLFFQKLNLVDVSIPSKEWRKADEESR